MLGTKISKEKIILLIFYTITSITIAYISYNLLNVNYFDWIKYFSWLVIIQILITFSFLKKLNINILSLSGISIALIYLFHFGQTLIQGTIPNFKIVRVDNFVEISDPYFFKLAGTYSLIVIMMIVLGVLCMSNNFENVMPRNNKDSSYKRTIIIGWFLIFVAFPIQVYIDINKIISSFDGGYLNIFENAANGYVGEVGYLSFTGFALIMLGYSENKKKAFFIFTFICTYLLITMISGSRGRQLTFLLLFIYLLHKTVFRFNWKKISIILVAGVLLIAVLNATTVYRGMADKNLSLFFNIYLNALQNNPLIDLISELGVSIQTPYQTIKQVPSEILPSNGLTYVYSLFSLLPNIGSFLNEINTHAHYVKNLYGFALGGSLIGELYYNFTIYGILVAPFIGIFISKFSRKIEILLESKQYYKFGFYIPLFVNILWWIRDAFVTIPRSFVFGGITLFCTNKFLQQYKLNNKKSEE